jgi:hypothetical protein
MSVYQKEYTKEFIEQLPVDFNKMKNIDLKQIPKKYHLVFTTDWNWGSHSTMRYEERLNLMELWLEYKKEQFKTLTNGI